MMTMLPIALAAIDALAEPDGGWEKYHKNGKDNRSRRSNRYVLALSSADQFDSNLVAVSLQDQVIVGTATIAVVTDIEFVVHPLTAQLAIIVMIIVPRTKNITQADELTVTTRNIKRLVLRFLVEVCLESMYE